MNVNLKSNLPPGKWKDKIIGVYKIEFDNGMFYIGSSADARGRFKSWMKYFSGGVSNRSKLSKTSEVKIEGCVKAVMSLVKLVNGSRIDLFCEEEKEIHKHKDDPFLLNKSLFPRRAVIKCLKDGTIIERFDSIESCFKKIGGYHRRLQEALKGERATIGGYVFKYENPAFWPKPKIGKKYLPGYVHPLAKRVAKYDLSGNFICFYPCSDKAAKELGVDSSDLRRHILGKMYFKGLKGFMFKFA